ncbi:response regulator transcription factor [Thermodesulfobacteriota bacterium]
MKPIRILVAEDDANILAGLVDTLESEGYEAKAAGDGDQALQLFSGNEFDLVLLDIMMPGKSGYDVCRSIRAADEHVPIIMLTCKAEEIDKVLGLQLGADDYVTKPFGVRELLARIAAVLRRARKSSGPNKEAREEMHRFTFGPAQINPLQYRACIGKQTIDLSSRELALIRYFHDHPNEVLSRERLLNEVWGIDYFGTTRTLDQHVAQLRKKIEPDPRRPAVITTVHGVGYRYEAPDIDTDNSE